MSKLTVTNFAKRTGSPFQKEKEDKVIQEEVIQKTQLEIQKEKQSDLIQKVNKKTADYQCSKPSSGVFTEVVTHGAFTSKISPPRDIPKHATESKLPSKTVTNGSSKSLLGYPSSANDLALDAKSDLESDKNISKEVKDKVIDKLFALVSMVQHTYESKVRVTSEFEKYKEIHLRNELRREKEHSEQLYKLNMNYQNEIVQAIQRLKSEMDISTNVENCVRKKEQSKDASVEFSTLGKDDLTNMNGANDITNDCKIDQNDTVSKHANDVND